MRKVIKTQVIDMGDSFILCRDYDDGAFAEKWTNKETGKTIGTTFYDGRGHAFVKTLGDELYYNDNAGIKRRRDYYIKYN